MKRCQSNKRQNLKLHSIEIVCCMKRPVVVFFLLCFYTMVNAQSIAGIAYSRENVFIDNPDKFDFIANVGGSHHLLTFTREEKPRLFIFNSKLQLDQKITLPFVLPDRAVIKITRVKTAYYICINKRFSLKYKMWKIDANGNSTDLSAAFEKLVLQVPYKAEPDFELVPDEKGFFFTYHTDVENTDKNTLTLLRTDSAFKTEFIHKVAYDFKRHEESLRQEAIMFGRYLLVLKTSRSNTALEVMKINLATGFTIRNSFYSAGYLYSQPGLHYNAADSGITVTALLSDMGYYTSKNYVFISRLNKILIEQAPPVILRSQFTKNTSTNFLSINRNNWTRLRTGGQQGKNYHTYQNYAVHDSSMLPAVTEPVTPTTEKYYNWLEQEQGIRFSLLDKNFKLVNERYVANTKDAYSILPDKFANFTIGNKEYMLAGHRFSLNRNSLLLVTSTDEMKLLYTTIGVNFRNEYILSKCTPIGQNRVIMPYMRRREAGLVQLTVE
jgi:hypothetical protein